jgi:ribosomal protein L37AE/L43A
MKRCPICGRVLEWIVRERIGAWECASCPYNDYSDPPEGE